MSKGPSERGYQHAYSPCHCRNGGAIWHVHRGVSDDHHLEQSVGKKRGVDKEKKNKRVIVTKSLRYSLVIKEEFNRKELSKTKQSSIREYLNGNRLPRKSLLWVSS